jgi:aspartate aminotransferase
LLEEQILVVPGRGFGRAGYIRIAFCVEDKVILNSRDGFARAAKKLGL